MRSIDIYMAPPPIQLGIRITEEALPAFAESIREAVAPVTCQSGETAECVTPERRDTFIHDVLKDGRLDPIEAPALHFAVIQSDGSKVLDANAVALFRQITRGTNALLHEDQSILELVQSSKKDAKRLANTLANTADNLAKHIQFAEAKSAESRVRAESKLNFISAENLWGLSAWITFDGRPFSDAEWTGRREFVAGAPGDRYRASHIGRQLCRRCHCGYQSLRPNISAEPIWLLQPGSLLTGPNK